MSKKRRKKAEGPKEPTTKTRRVPVTVAEQVASVARKRTAAGAVDERERQKKRDKRQREREARALANAQTPYGLSAKMTAKLQDAAKRVQEHPRHKQLLEKASVAQRVQLAKRNNGIRDTTPPEKFMGVPIEQYNSSRTMGELDDAFELPRPMSEIRKG